MVAIVKREFRAYLNSLVAYIAIGIFILVSGLFLWVYPERSVFDTGYADMYEFFAVAPFLLLIIIPALSMRSIAEERKDGTFLTLVTKPVSLTQIVLAKYLAILAIVMLTLILSLINVLVLWYLAMPEGNIDVAAIVTSYCGLILVSSVFISIGLFASSCTSNQIVAFSLGAFSCFIIYYAGYIFWALVEGSQLGNLLSYLSLYAHFESLSRGLIDLRDVVYFLLLSFLFFGLTEFILRKRKW